MQEKTIRVGKCVDKRNQKLVFVSNRGDLVVGIKNFAFIEPERFDDVLVGMGMNGLFECLS